MTGMLQLHLVQLGEDDWITIDDVHHVWHVIHRGPHVIDRETLIEYRIIRWALRRAQRVDLGWADTIAGAEQAARNEFAETQRKLHQQPGTHHSGWGG